MMNFHRAYLTFVILEEIITFAVKTGIANSLYLVPILYWCYRAYHGTLGDEPWDKISSDTGYVVLYLLLANLWIGAIQRVGTTGPWFRRLVTERSRLGVFAGFYAMLHFLSYLTKESFETKAFEQIYLKCYLLCGFLAAFILWIMALTSNKLSVRKLGPRWKKLHRVVHIASVLVILHVFYVEKANIPLLAGLIIPLAPFQIYRLVLSVRSQYFEGRKGLNS